MHRVGDGLFLIRLELDTKLNGLCVGLQENIGLRRDLPVDPSLEMFHHAHLDRLFLVVAHLDLEGFI